MRVGVRMRAKGIVRMSVRVKMRINDGTQGKSGSEYEDEDQFEVEDMDEREDESNGGGAGRLRVWMRAMAVEQAGSGLRLRGRTFLMQNSPFVQHMVFEGETSHVVVPDTHDVTTYDI